MLSGWSDVLWRAGGLLVVVVLALVVVRPFLLAMVSRAPVGPARGSGDRLALPEGPTPGVLALDVARNDPEHTAEVIRQWLATSP